MTNIDQAVIMSNIIKNDNLAILVPLIFSFCSQKHLTYRLTLYMYVYLQHTSTFMYIYNRLVQCHVCISTTDYYMYVYLQQTSECMYRILFGSEYYMRLYIGRGWGLPRGDS